MTVSVPPAYLRAAFFYLRKKNKRDYFSYLILYFRLVCSYSIHVPDDRYRLNDFNGGIQNAAPAWNYYSWELDLW